jgi:hypothetical protein
MFELLTSIQLEEYWMAATETAAKQGAGWLVAGASAGAETGKEDWPNGCDGDSFWSEHADDLCV